jgi:hypothetical protein
MIISHPGVVVSVGSSSNGSEVFHERLHIAGKKRAAQLLAFARQSLCTIQPLAGDCWATKRKRSRNFARLIRKIFRGTPTWMPSFDE